MAGNNVRVHVYPELLYYALFTTHPLSRRQPGPDANLTLSREIIIDLLPTGLKFLLTQNKAYHYVFISNH